MSKSTVIFRSKPAAIWKMIGEPVLSRSTAGKWGSGGGGDIRVIQSIEKLGLFISFLLFVWNDKDVVSSGIYSSNCFVNEAKENLFVPKETCALQHTVCYFSACDCSFRLVKNVGCRGD